jgi:hypothetical protein
MSDFATDEKIESLSQHLGVVQELLETLILKLNYDGIYPATRLWAELEAISSHAKRSKDTSPHRLQLLTQICQKLGKADAWAPPSVQARRKRRS